MTRGSIRLVWLLSACVGFLSLSQEILWVRYVGFAYYSVPQAFSFVLTMFLLGIAGGAFLGKLLCASTTRLLTASGCVLMAAGVLDMFGPLATATGARQPFGILIWAALIASCAALKGIVFPIVHHLGSTDSSDRLGRSVSRVYFFNIIGATLGPLVTGLLLLDYLSLQHSMLLMGWLTVMLGVVCLACEQPRRIALASLVPALLLLAMMWRDDTLASSLAFRYGNRGLAQIIENKSGVLHAVRSETGGDYIYGGNVYDGRPNIDPRVNSNGLQRIFVMAVLQPQPRDVLVIGLSTGAWARLLTGFPGVERINVVEINPGYLQLIQGYPQISPFLSDPRVTVDVDDGRRWLRRHPERRYDLIVMNTTLHWRAYSTNLLSREYLSLIRAHLKPGGMITYNSTGSGDVLRTADEVFPYAFRYWNFVVASDQDFRARTQGGEQQLYRIALDGRPVLDPHSAVDREFVRKTLAEPFVSTREDRARTYRDAEVITDWNLLPEYKYGREFPCVQGHTLVASCAH